MTVSETARFDEERLAALLRLLPPAPEAWVRAAKELPLVRAELADVGRAVEEAEFRAALAEREAVDELADVEAHGHPAGTAEGAPSEPPVEDAGDTGEVTPEEPSSKPDRPD